jgi:dihydrofolate reductase
MGKVNLGISMSLDGFIAGPNDDVQHLFKWYFAGTEEFPVQEGRFTLKVSKESAKLLDAEMSNTGAMIAGRRMFDVAGAWNGTPPYTTCVIMTHNPPQQWMKEGSPFVFVTDGIESAVKKAKELAGDKNVAVATPQVMQQAIKAGLLDEIHIDVVPVLLGQGTRLFEYLGIEPIELETIHVIPAVGVTHMAFRVPAK